MSKKIKFCPNCGNIVGAYVEVCQACGFNLPQPIEQKQPKPVEQKPSEPVKKPKTPHLAQPVEQKPPEPIENKLPEQIEQKQPKLVEQKPSEPAKKPKTPHLAQPVEQKPPEPIENKLPEQIEQKQPEPVKEPKSPYLAQPIEQKQPEPLKQILKEQIEQKPSEPVEQKFPKPAEHPIWIKFSPYLTEFGKWSWIVLIISALLNIFLISVVGLRFVSSGLYGQYILFHLWDFLRLGLLIIISFKWVEPVFTPKCVAKDWDFLMHEDALIWIKNLTQGKIDIKKQIPMMFFGGIIITICSPLYFIGLIVLWPAIVLMFFSPFAPYKFNRRKVEKI